MTSHGRTGERASTGGSGRHRSTSRRPLFWTRFGRGNRRALISAGSVLVAGVLASALTLSSTTASFTDGANVNLSEIVSNELPLRFGVVLPDGTVKDISDGDPIPLTFPKGAELIPGGSVTASVTVFNNTDNRAALRAKMETIGDGTVVIDGVSHPNITSFLRFTASRASYTFINAQPIATASNSAGTILARTGDKLSEGDLFVPDGNEWTITVRVDYPDAPGTEAYVTGLSRLQMVLTAEEY